jgi:hypothetical protein
MPLLSGWMGLDQRVIQRGGFDFEPDDPGVLQLFKNTIQTSTFEQRIIRAQPTCKRPNRLGKPRHLQPCSTTYRLAFNTKPIYKINKNCYRFQWQHEF